ncbi:MAG: FtsW/RodA/SpoVE family cell cycle protein [Planctomycetota bacterium]
MDAATSTNPLQQHAIRVWRQLALFNNWPLLVAVGVLAGVGLLTIGSVDPGEAKRQGIFLTIGLCAMLAFQAVNYAKLGRLALPFYVLSLLLVGVTVVGGVIGLPFVPRTNGACNWIRVGPLSVQPAELMKVSFIMLLARHLRYRETQRTLKGLVVPLLLAAVPMALILKQPDLGTCIVFVPTTLAMLFVAGAKLRHFAMIFGVGLVTLPILWLSGQSHVPLLKHGPDLVKEYQRDRVVAMFKNDESTLQGTGYQQFYGLAAMGSGGLGGKGVGVTPIGHKVPESQNDMIFVVIGEQFGFVGSFVVIAAYCVLFVAAIEVATHTKEPFGRLVAVGVTAALAGQAFVNLAVATKLMPVTGVTLPFVSSGGSSLIASFMAIGILLNVGQHRPILLSREAFSFGN